MRRGGGGYNYKEETSAVVSSDETDVGELYTVFVS